MWQRALSGSSGSGSMTFETDTISNGQTKTYTIKNGCFVADSTAGYKGYLRAVFIFCNGVMTTIIPPNQTYETWSYDTTTNVLTYTKTQRLYTDTLDLYVLHD